MLNRRSRTTTRSGPREPVLLAFHTICAGPLVWTVKRHRTMLDSVTIKRFEKALASGKLKGLAEQMTVEGLSQAAVYNLFELFWEFLGAAHREADEEVLAGCLESIVGWCGPGSKWFEHYLTNEEIDEYRKTIA